MHTLKNTKPFTDHLRTLVVLGVIAASIVYSTYFYKFSGPLSDLNGDWGTFGDYVGGLLNPFFAFLAFVGVLITISIQTRQLKAIREQSTIEELQRLLSNAAASVDELLRTYPSYHAAKPHIQESMPPLTLFDQIAAFGTRALAEGSSTMNEPALLSVEKDISQSIVAVCLELQGLAWVLGAFKTAKGSNVVIEFYKYKYSAITVWLDAMGCISNHNRVQEVFEPKKNRQFFVADTSPYDIANKAEPASSK